MSKPSSHRTWLAWIFANAIGELAGLGVVFAVGFAVAGTVGEPRSGGSFVLLALVAVLLGAYEGIVVGWAQWLVLRRLAPEITRRAWILATVVGASVAWLLGMVPSTLAALQPAAETPPPEPPLAVVLAMAGAMGVVCGGILAGAQAVVLRRAGRGAVWWLGANALAWTAGMPWIFWLVGVTVAERRDAASVALFVGGLGLAGAIVGAIHGAVLVRRLAPCEAG